MVSGDRAFPTGTVTMLFTDVEGSTRLLKQLGERYGGMLAEHRRLLREAVAAHGGREMDTQGDAFFVAFPRARNAVEAAVEAQRALAAQAWPEGVECRVRMGLHTGEPAVGEEGYHGMGVHRGARICAAGHGGQILLSNTTRELAEDELPAGVALRDLGEQWLKDIDRPERIYQLLVDGLQSEFPPLRTAPPPASAGTAARRRRPRAVLVAGALAALAAVTATIVLITGGGSKPGAAGEVSADSVGIFRPDNGHPWARSRSVRRRAASQPASARSGSRTSTHTASHGSIPSSASRFRRSRSETGPLGSRSAAALCGWRTGRTGRSR